MNVSFYIIGDAPACQLEAGQQKGGHYFCWCCGMRATRGQEIDYMFNAKKLNLKERIEKLTATRY